MSKSFSKREALAAIEEIRSRERLLLVKQGAGEVMTDDEMIADQAKDIDYWMPATGRAEIRAVFETLGGYVLCTCTSSFWLNHDVYLFSCNDGNLQIDVSFGDLMAGPVMLATELRLLQSVTPAGRFRGAACIADLLLRPLARGKQISGKRLQLACAAWQEMTPDERSAYRSEMKGQFGGTASDECRSVLEGSGSQPKLSLLLRTAVTVKLLSSRGAFRVGTRKLGLALAGILTRRGKPFGRYQKGLLIALIGTDGVGKSSTADRLSVLLNEQRTKASIRYLGRARGNLPGVETARKLVGARVRSKSPRSDVYELSALNKLVTWFYSFEYLLRAIRPYLDARLFGKVVMCDRYVYDLALIPGYSQAAVRFSRALCPRPDVIVLLEASPQVVLSRKAERNVETIVLHQAVLKNVIESQLARKHSLSLRTDVLSREEVCSSLLRLINPAIHSNFP